MLAHLEMIPSEDIENLPTVVLYNQVASLQEESLRLEQALSEAVSLLRSFINLDGDEEEMSEAMARAEMLVEEFSSIESF
jgi:hypothetical protein